MVPIVYALHIIPALLFALLFTILNPLEVMMMTPPPSHLDISIMVDVRALT